MGEIQLLGYICERCNHKWIPRANSTHKPIVCSACKSPYWNIPRRNSPYNNNQKLKKNNTNYELFPTKLNVTSIFGKKVDFL